MSTSAPYYDLHPPPNKDGNIYGPPDDGYDEQSHSGLLEEAYKNGLTEVGQIASLLEAANSAADATARMQIEGTLEETQQRLTPANGPDVLGDDGGAEPGQTQRGKRKRGTDSAPQHADNNMRNDSTASPAAGAKRSRHMSEPDAGPHDPSLEDNNTANSSPSRAFEHHNLRQQNVHQNAITDARAAGVHSAAALFRKPNANPAKKYTRPPMSKLFMSLQLTPENFLHLQAAAKNYMLDPAYPERQNCVGNRGKGDTDMVKLRLFNCVNEFLSNEIGERFFGINAPAPSADEGADAAAALGEENPPPPRTWIWPRDASKIITLVTPLLRRMVTNERQRQYAVESRKGGSQTKRTRDDEIGDGSGDPGQEDLHRFHENDVSLDPALPSAHATAGHILAHEHSGPNQRTLAQTSTVDQQASTESSVIRLLVMKDNRKLLPRLDIPNHSSSRMHILPFGDLRSTIRNLFMRIELIPSGRMFENDECHVREPISGADRDAKYLHAGEKQDEAMANLMRRLQETASAASAAEELNSRAQAAALMSSEMATATAMAAMAATSPSLPDESERPDSYQAQEPSDLGVVAGQHEPEQSGQSSVYDQRTDGDAMERASSHQPPPHAASCNVNVHVLLETGLTSVETPEEWEHAKAIASQTGSLEGMVKVIVRVL